MVTFHPVFASFKCPHLNTMLVLNTDKVSGKSRHSLSLITVHDTAGSSGIKVGLLVPRSGSWREGGSEPLLFFPLKRQCPDTTTVAFAMTKGQPCGILALLIALLSFPLKPFSEFSSKCFVSRHVSVLTPDLPSDYVEPVISQLWLYQRASVNTHSLHSSLFSS